MATKSEREAYRDAHPDTWIPIAEGDQLAGNVVEVDSAWSDQRAKNHDDGWYPLITVATDDGVEMKWHAFETVAYNQVMKHQPQPGEHITVTFRGESANAKKGQNPAKLFTLRVNDRDPATAAQRVYGSLSPSGPTAKAVEPDVPIDTRDLDDVPFE